VTVSIVDTLLRESHMAKRKAPETAKQEPETFQVGRDAKTGRFISVKDAQRRKKTAVVETYAKQ
jgi:hypothetical protein